MAECLIEDFETAECPDSDGGVYVSYATSYNSVASVTFDANNQITGFTMTSAGVWTKLPYSDEGDILPSYNQTGTRTGTKVNYEQVLTSQFTGLSAGLVKAANSIVKCCEGLIVVHFWNNGQAWVQGIQKTGATPFFTAPNTKAKAVVSVLSNDKNGVDSISLTITSKLREIGYLTTLTPLQIEAL